MRNPARSSRPPRRRPASVPTESKASIRPAALALVLGLAVGVLALDQIIKQVIVATMSEGEQIDVLGPVAGLLLRRNAGAAYSLGAGYTWIFAILAAAVAVFIIVFTRRIKSPAWATVFGLLLGGTLGNLGDRLFREPGFGVGHVVDFIYIPWLGFTCNVADVAITAAMVLFVVLTLRGIGLDGRRRTDAARDSTTNAERDAATGAEHGEP